MDEHTIEKATEDIALIKKVIERTSGSLISFSQVFIWWGLLFLGAYVINSCIFYLPGFIPEFGVSAFLYTNIRELLIILGVLLAYNKVINKTPLIGLSKQLIIIWIIIIGFQYITSLLYVILLREFHMSEPVNAFITWLAFDYLTYAFGFLSISILTRFKLPGYFAILYSILALFCFLPNPLASISFLGSSKDMLILMKSLNISILGLIRPLTFLLMGLYLRKQRIREN
jgi:hypothetical protein